MSTQKAKVVKQKTVLTASNGRRVAAHLVDQIVYLFLLLAVSTVLTFLGILDVEDAISLANLRLMNFMIFFVGFAYFFGYPLIGTANKLKGQTLGKKFMSIRTIKINGEDIDAKTSALRTSFGILVEGFTYAFATLSLFQFLTFVGLNITGLIDYILPAYIAIFLISLVVMFIRPSHQMLHDYVASTVVIQVDQRR